MNITNKEILKKLRKYARENGMTFKVDKSCLINGGTVYKFVDRKSGVLITGGYYNLLNTYEDYLNGCIDERLEEYKEFSA